MHICPSLNSTSYHNQKIMKTFFFFIALTFTSLAYSQGNLQFNKVINWKIPQQSGNCDGCGPYCASINGTIEVPSGKVWKIETSNYAGAASDWQFSLDNYLLFSNEITSGGGIFYHQAIRFPIWLPAGTYTYKGKYYTNCQVNPTFLGASTSIIEFNIVP